MIGSGKILTITQLSTRRECAIIFEAAYVPNVKLILTDDHKLLEIIVAQKRTFWETSQEVFHVNLYMEISAAESEIVGLYI